MHVNADFSRLVRVLPNEHHWVPSPQPGVERVMLDRVGAEQARATSLVRYAPGSRFPVHEHPAGEEILVLAGTFSADGQDYPAGWYLRNPPGSRHQPSSAEGTLIFVKLRQMQAHERETVQLDTQQPSAWQHAQGREVCSLYADAFEQTTLQRLPPGVAVFTGLLPGAELLVLTGELLADGVTCAPGSWIRLPAGEYPGFVAGDAGVTLYLKIARPGPADLQASSAAMPRNCARMK